jgi:undecaprenyl-diphosphatase
VSSHATNAFGVAVFGGLLLKVKYKWIFPSLIFWAAIVSYSRIYLGVHYPGDIIVGGIVGSIIGWLMFLLFKWIISKRYPV